MPTGFREQANAARPPTTKPQLPASHVDAAAAAVGLDGGGGGCGVVEWRALNFSAMMTPPPPPRHLNGRAALGWRRLAP